MTTLFAKRVVLRPLVSDDFPQWREVRRTNLDWLTKWEPKRLPSAPDVVEDRSAFAMRCHSRERERQLGSGYGFGVFVGGNFAGEVNLNSVQRGPFQNAYVGYWIDQRHAGKGYTPEGVVAVMRYAFEELDLHRVQISIVPRNTASRRVVEKIGVRAEGVAERYLEINGTWDEFAWHVGGAAGHLGGSSEQLIIGHAAMGETYPLGFFAVHDFAEQHRSSGGLGAGDVLEHPGMATSGVDADLEEAVIEPGGLAGQAHIADQGKVHAGADGCAVDCGDGWQGASADSKESFVDRQQSLLGAVAEVGEVSASAKRSAGSP